MTASIARVTGDEAYDLIYYDHLAKLSVVDQETMQRALSNSSRVWIAYSDNKVAVIWGLIPPTLLSERAYLWMFTTEHMQGHEFVFIRYTQRMMGEMLKEFPIIVGHAQADNHKSIRWLKWLGAKFGESQGPVIPFEIRRK